MRLATTRDAAGALRAEFETWLAEQVAFPSAEDWIDPQHFIQWQEQRPTRTRTGGAGFTQRARLSGSDGRRGSYSVLPIVTDREIKWLDAAGFELATSESAGEFATTLSAHDDYFLSAIGEPEVRRTFQASKR